LAHQKEQIIFQNFLLENNLKFTEQRRLILEIFLATETHASVEELYDKIKRKYPDIGHTTVYRTLKLFAECGLAKELRFSDGVSRYEHLFGHDHHDHLICTQCGKLIEVVDPEIEALQQRRATASKSISTGWSYMVCATSVNRLNVMKFLANYLRPNIENEFHYLLKSGECHV
jgi:Fur family ferric uptake transcriptional regulator